MEKISFPEGIIKVKFDGKVRLAEYMGRQKGFECIVCGKGENCHTFNFFDSPEQYANGDYETIGLGARHIGTVELIQ